VPFDENARAFLSTSANALSIGLAEGHFFDSKSIKNPNQFWLGFQFL